MPYPFKNQFIATNPKSQHLGIPDFIIEWQKYYGQGPVTRISFWLGRSSTLTKSHIIPNLYKTLQKLQEKYAFQFGEIDALKIKYFLEIHFFSKIDIHWVFC